jgi:hypothetical protein
MGRSHAKLGRSADVDDAEDAYAQDVASLGVNEAVRLRRARRAQAAVRAGNLHDKNAAGAGAARDDALSRLKAAAHANRDHKAASEAMEKLEHAALAAAGLAMAEGPAPGPEEDAEGPAAGPDAAPAEHLLTDEEVEALSTMKEPGMQEVEVGRCTLTPPDP